MSAVRIRYSTNVIHPQCCAPGSQSSAGFGTCVLSGDFASIEEIEAPSTQSCPRLAHPRIQPT